jgi:hypothetical protein
MSLQKNELLEKVVAKMPNPSRAQEKKANRK